MKKIVYIKNIGADSVKLLTRLMKFNKSVGMSKDTFILKDVSLEDYVYLLALKDEIKSKENKDVIITFCGYIQ